MRGSIGNRSLFNTAPGQGRHPVLKLRTARSSLQRTFDPEAACGVVFEHQSGSGSAW